MRYLLTAVVALIGAGLFAGFTSTAGVTAALLLLGALACVPIMLLSLQAKYFEDTLMSIAILLLLVAALACGTLAGEIFFRSGPLQLLLRSAVPAAGLAWLVARITRYVRGDRHVSELLLALLTFVSMMATPVDLVRYGRARAELMRLMVPEVESAGQTLFERVDADKNGTITEAELSVAIQGSNFTEPERRVLRHVDAHLSEIGHVISSYTTTTWIQSGDSLMPVITTHNVYGVGRDDLRSHRQRVEDRYHNW